MTVRRVARRLIGGLVLGLVALSGCDKERPSSDAPGDDERSAQLEAMEGKVGGADPAAAAAGTQPGKQALPKVRDRDPEEEKRKMARSRAQSEKADDALTAGRLDQAIVAAREALRMHEQNVHAMLIIAEAYFRQGKYEIVQAVITSGLAVDPKIRTPAETSRLYNLQGFALLAMGKDQLATQSFKKAAENDEKNAAAWNNLGTRYLEAGDAKTALSCFSYAVDLDARFYKAHLNRGAAQRAVGQWKEAEASFRTALELRPSYAEAYFDLGILYLDADPFPGLDTKQRLDKAISYLTKYRGLASSSGSSGARVSKSGASPNVPAATREVADDYIRVARKGLERVQRDAERGRTATSPDGAGEARPDGGEEASPASSAASREPEAEPGSAAPQKPGAKPEPATKPAPAAPQKPGAKPEPATKPAPVAPQKTAPAAPQAPAPAAPRKPVSPASPPSTDAPPSASPPPAKPAPPTPKPTSKTQPVSPQKPAPKPVSPQKPTPKPVAPQKPTPQPVSPQKPSSSASADLPLRNSSHTTQPHPGIRTDATAPHGPAPRVPTRAHESEERAHVRATEDGSREN